MLVRTTFDRLNCSKEVSMRSHIPGPSESGKCEGRMDHAESFTWSLVGFMWIAYFLNYTDRQVAFSIFPVLKSELHFTYIQLGLIGSFFLWVYAFCSPISGQIADRFSKRALLVLSLLLWSGTTTLTGLSSSAHMLLFFRALMGVTESLFMPAAVALIANTHPPDKRSRAFTIFATAQLAGGVAGGSYGGYMAQRYNWRLGFYLLGVLGIVFANPYSAFLARLREKAQLETKKLGEGIALVALLRVPTYLVLCLAFCTYTFTARVLR